MDRQYIYNTVGNIKQYINAKHVGDDHVTALTGKAITDLGYFRVGVMATIREASVF